MILGPADADHYRVKVGRYGDRWYTDPLPTCEIAEATDAVWPSVSTIKKASGNDWTFVGLKRVSRMTDDELRRLPTLDQAERYDTLKSVNQRGLSVAAGRGTIVHWWGEDLLHGKSPRTVTEIDLMAHKIPAASLPEAQRYLPALQAFVDQHQPTLIATEYVVINRVLGAGTGYGCTPDGLLLIDGKTYAYDFKTRSEDSDHGAYPEEAAQIAAGCTTFGYMIVEGDNGPKRQLVPPADGGIVISIKPEGCRIYPIDLAAGFDHFAALHTWWTARRTEREPIGKPWAPRKATTSNTSHSTTTDESQSLNRPDLSLIATTAAPHSSGSSNSSIKKTPPSLRESSPTASSVHARAKLLVDAGYGPDLIRHWPPDVPGFKSEHQHDASELNQILAAVRTVEDEHDMPWHPADAPSPLAASIVNAMPRITKPSLDEGPLVDDITYESLKKRHQALLPENRAVLERITAEVLEAHASISLRQLRSVRRWEIARALILWCEAGWDDDVIWDLLAAVTDTARAALPFMFGPAIGALTIDQARALADMAQNVLDGTSTITHTDRWQLEPAS